MTKSAGSIFVTAMVSGNFAVTLWHLHILQNVHPMESGGESFTLGSIVGSVSLFAILLIWTRFYKVGAWISAGLLLIGLTIGSYEHFLSVNPNNVFIMPHGDWTLSFQISAVLLVVVELLGIWAAVRTATLRA
jgi:hypothetical protein